MDRPPARIIAILPAAGAAEALQAQIDANADIACALLANADDVEALKALAHPNDIALLLNDDAEAAKALDLDGVHLTLPGQGVRQARALLGEDRIIGAFCGVSRHAAMTAGEQGADYVAFGPCDIPEHRPEIETLLAWWQEAMEPPCVAWAAPTADATALEQAGADFLALRE